MERDQILELALSAEIDRAQKTLAFINLDGASSNDDKAAARSWLGMAIQRSEDVQEQATELAKQGHEDLDTIVLILEQEAREAPDHELALRLDGNAEADVESVTAKYFATVDHASILKAIKRNTSTTTKTDALGLYLIDMGSPALFGDCGMCYLQVPFFNSISLGCGQVICNKCVHGAFEASTWTKELFPPRCCVAIPLKVAADVLDPLFIRRFLDKSAEYDAVRSE